MTSSKSIFCVILLFLTSAPTHAAPPDQQHVDEYVKQLLDQDHAQHAMAAARLKAVNQRQQIPVEAEHRLANYLRQPVADTRQHAELISQVASVLATTHPDSAAMVEIVGALTTTLDREPSAIARRGCAEALYMIARHTGLPTATIRLLEERAFNDTDRKVKIGAMRALIASGPEEQIKRRLSEILMARTSMNDEEFAAPNDWDYETRADQNAMLQLLWSLHQPDVPESVIALWASKLDGANLHDSAYRMLNKIVGITPLPQSVYELVLAAAERDSKVIDSGRREKLHQLLHRSRRLQAAGTSPVAVLGVHDVALAGIVASEADIGKRRTAAYQLREFANTNSLARDSLELLAGVAESEQDFELRQVALRIFGYAAPKDYVDLMHRYFDTGRYDHLTLQIFLASYGHEAWLRKYGQNTDRHPRARAAAMYHFTRSGFDISEEMVAFLQVIATDDADYSVRQAAGEALDHIGAWVPMMTRLERNENQLQALFYVWLMSVAVFFLGALAGICLLVIRWRRVRLGFSALGILGWVVVTVLLVPAIGFGALSLFIHNGPIPTPIEQFFRFLPTYILIGLFTVATLKVIRVGINSDTR